MPAFTTLPAARRHCAALIATGKSGKARFSVGDNLYCNVAKGGTNARWVFLYKWYGKPKEMFFGSADAISLDRAKVMRGAAYELLKSKRDPLAERQAEAAKPVIVIETVRKLIGDLIEARRGNWKDPIAGAARQWSIVEAHIPELLGKLSTEISFEGVRANFYPFTEKWTVQRAYLAQELLEDALNLAYNRGQIAKNPAIWNGVLSTAMPKKIVSSKRRDAMDPALVPGLIATLMADGEVEAKILLAIVLTGMREAAVSEMRRDEIDGDVWTVPADRMKRKKGQEPKPFSVPLSRQMLALIAAQPEHESGLVFPSKTGKVMSNTQLNNKMRSLGLKTEDENVDIHGFRTSMATWGNDNTAHEERVIDAALGHVSTQKEKDELSATARTYNRADYFQKRIALMADWAEYCFGESNLVVLPRRKAA